MRYPYKMFELLQFNLKWHQKLFIKFWTLCNGILCKISRKYKYRNLNLNNLYYLYHSLLSPKIVMIYKYPNERDEMEKYCYNTALKNKSFRRRTKNEIHLQDEGRIRFVRFDNKDSFRGYIDTLVVISKSITKKDWRRVFVKKPLWMSGKTGYWGYDEVTRFEDVE